MDFQVPEGTRWIYSSSAAPPSDNKMITLPAPNPKAKAAQKHNAGSHSAEKRSGTSLPPQGDFPDPSSFRGLQQLSPEAALSAA